MNKLILLMGLMAASVYLFVTAPPPLEENRASVEQPITIEAAFGILDVENSAVRALYTREIVGEGKRVHLDFDESWQKRGVQAGPIPSLFLRETASYLEQNGVKLRLFLGSDRPINPANRFSGVQQEAFERMKKTRRPQIFFEPDTQLYTAMFPDVAVATTCTECHNQHVSSSKHDWQLDDLMGATTWSHPAERVSTEELLRMLQALRNGFAHAYSEYLTKTESFDIRPEIGERWPRDGFSLPSAKVFMRAVRSKNSARTLQALFATKGDPLASE